MVTSNYAKKIISSVLITKQNKCLLIIFWLCFHYIPSAYSQDSSIRTPAANALDTNEASKKVSEDSAYVVNFTAAAFPGGKTEWIRYLVHNLSVPEEMRGTKFNRSIVVKFTVDEKGRLKNFEEAGNDTLKKEAIRVVKASGKWIPAYSNLTPIASECERKIIFQWN